VSLANILLAAHLGSSPWAYVGVQQDATIVSTGAAFIRQGEHARIKLERATHDEACSGAVCRQVNLSESSIRWFLLVPEPRDYDNPAYCKGVSNPRRCHQPIAYHQQELASLSGAESFDVADVRELRTLGSHRIVARISWNGFTQTAPAGPDPQSSDYAMAPAVEIVVRKDDSYVGRLSELLGAPFVLGPTYIPGLGHETDQRVAADCVALVIYGRRRLGESVPYMAPAALHARLKVVAEARGLVDSEDRPAHIGPLKLGDVLYFGFQTAVVSGNLSSDGYPTSSTKIIHSYHGLAEEVELDALPYRRSPVEILRWNANSE